MDNKIVKRLVLAVAAAPWVLLLIFALGGAFDGVDFLFSTSYGFDGFMLVVILGLFQYAPVFIISGLMLLIVGLPELVRLIRNRRRRRSAERLFREEQDRLPSGEDLNDQRKRWYQ